MKRPAFQFYPDNWRNSSKLRRCSWAARGAWIEIMCLMHDSDRYGVLEWPIKEMADAIGCKRVLLTELVEKGVLKGADSGEIPAFIYTPKSGRKWGDPVALIEAQKGPLWFSSRMVVDEHKRIARAESTGPDASPKASPNPPIGATFGPRASPSPSPTALIKDISGLSPAPGSPSENPAGEIDLLGHKLNGHAPKTVPDCPHQELLALWAEVMPDLSQHDPALWHENARADNLRARWRSTAKLKGWATKEDGLDYFRRLFVWCRNSDFLMGRSQSRDRKPFRFELAWLVNPTNWTKVHEGKFNE